MFGISDRVVTQTISSTFTATGVKPPKALTDAVARAAKLDKAAGTLGADGPGALGVAVTAAIDAGQEPSADPAVQRALTAQQLASNHGLIDQITGGASERLREVCQQQADDIVQGWAKAFTTAAATLTAAHERIGDVPLEDTDSIMAKGSDIAAVWANARGAVQTIDATLAGWSALGSFTRMVSINQQHRVLILSPVGYQTWLTLDPKIGPWNALLAGLPLSLPTFAEYRQRVALIEQGAAEVETVVDTERSAIAGREIRVAAVR